MKAYAGSYENAELGRIVISIEGNSLVARFGNLTSSHAPIKDDTFVANFLPGEASLTLKGDKNSGFTEFTMLGKAFIRAQ